ncbi:hypothetical protein AusDCA_0837 [Desulfitobacterium sp. AusDCA]
MLQSEYLITLTDEDVVNVRRTGNKQKILNGMKE